MNPIFLFLLQLMITGLRFASSAEADEGPRKEDSFDEELLLKRLPSLHMLANFRFKTRTSSQLGNHYDLFPKLIGELIQVYDLDEVHLSLTQGFWRHASWGYQPQPSTPVGAQVWVWFRDNTTQIDEKWKKVVHALSGLFCASLSQLEPTLTVSPEFSFRPSGVISGQRDKDRLRYGVLPSENICTENLTPWKKLLPCHDRGLASLLSPLQLYDSHFHSMALDARRMCQEGAGECVSPKWEVTQTMISVFDAPVLKKSLNWSLKEYFGGPLRRMCSAAHSSNIYVDYTNSKPTFHPEPTEILTENDKPVDMARFDLKKLFTESTLVSCDARRKKITQGNRRPLPPLFSEIRPGKDRLRPYFLELGLELPARSRCWVEIGFEKSLLRWTEYPPDAHRGFFIPAAVVTFQSRIWDNKTLPNGRNSLVGEALESGRDDSWLVQIFSEVLLVNLPTPDFSMPYNVICLVCTVVALAFGPIHNMTTKNLVFKDPEELKKGGLKMKVRNAVQKIFQKFRKRKSPETTEPTEHEKKE